MFEELEEHQMEYIRTVALLTDLLPEGHKQVEEICSHLHELPNPAMYYLENLCTELLSGMPLEHTFVWRKINAER